MKRYLELCVNIAILAVCALIVLTFIENHQRNTHPITPARVGDKVELKGVNWLNSKQTLLVVMKKDCHYCEMSVPFYKKLLHQAKKEKGFAIILILPQEVRSGREYLESIGLQWDNVLEGDLRSLGVIATPSIFLVDSNGFIKRQWLGYLRPEMEAEIVLALTN